MKAKTVDEVLAAMEWMLENVGWTQGWSYRDAQGVPINDPDDFHQIKSMCLVGALKLVEVQNEKIRDEAADSFNRYNYGLISFNDHLGRTKEQVIAAIRKTRELVKITGVSK